MSDRRLAAFLVGVAFLTRFQLYLGTAIFGTDGAAYLRIADAFSAGQFRDGLSSGIHPVFPLLISLLQPFLSTEQAGFWVSIVLGSAAAAPLFLVTRDAVGRPAAFVGGLLYGVHPHIASVHADVMTEGTFMFFLFGAVWLGWETIREPKWTYAMLAGLASAGAYLTRPEGILAVVGVPAWLFASTCRGGGRFRWTAPVLAVVTACAAASPWLIWQRAQQGRWTISSKGSVQLVEGTSQVSPEVLEERRPHARFLRQVGKVSYFVLLPLIAIGLFSKRLRWGIAYSSSFPLIYWAALAWAVGRYPYVSHRYLLSGMALLLPWAALGMVRLSRWVGRPRLMPAVAGLLVFAAVLRDLRWVRQELVPAREAAVWISSQEKGAEVASTTEQVVYLAGGRFFPVPLSWEEMVRQSSSLRYLVVTREDRAKGVVPYLDRLGLPAMVAGQGAMFVFRIKASP